MLQRVICIIHSCSRSSQPWPEKRCLTNHPQMEWPLTANLLFTQESRISRCPADLALLPRLGLHLLPASHPPQSSGFPRHVPLTHESKTSQARVVKASAHVHVCSHTFGQTQHRVSVKIYSASRRHRGGEGLGRVMQGLVKLFCKGTVNNFGFVGHVVTVPAI